MNHGITIRMSAAGAPVVPNNTWVKEPSTTVQVMRSLYNCEMTANNRILMRKAGKYLIKANASLTAAILAGVIGAAIGKNGNVPTASSIAQGSTLAAILGAQPLTAQLFDTAIVNDFYELWVTAAATTSLIGAAYTLEAYQL